jgi:hypothetical protein
MNWQIDSIPAQSFKTAPTMSIRPQLQIDQIADWTFLYRPKQLALISCLPYRLGIVARQDYFRMGDNPTGI